jgi:hypothetical protein
MTVALDTYSSLIESLAKGKEIYEIFASGRNTTVLERIDIATRLGSIFCSIGSFALNGATFFVTGTSFSEICKKWGPLLSKISRVANIIQNSTTIAVCQEQRGTTNLGEYVQLIAPGMRAVLSFVPGEVYSSISQTLRGSEAESWWNKPSTIEGFSELIQRSDILIDGIQRIGSIFTLNTQSPSNPPQISLFSLLEQPNNTSTQPIPAEAMWGMMEKLWQQKLLSPSDFESLIYAAFEKRETLRFLCTFTRNIVLCPLKHPESGALFEKAVVEQKFRENTVLSFSLDGRVFQITRNELVPSPEDQVRIYKILKARIEGICNVIQESTSPSRQIYQARQTDAAATEQLRCQWNLAVFVELKPKAWEKIKGFFDEMNETLRSRSYWWTDPRQGLITLAQSELAKAERGSNNRPILRNYEKL